MKHADLLIEIHTGELPPTQLLTLANAFLLHISQQLSKLQFNFKTARHFATPRRLAVLLEAVAEQQPTQEIVKRGPTLQAAFDQDDNPTAATLGFMRSLKITREQLITINTNEGEWVGYKEQQTGNTITAALPQIIEEALKKLPAAKRMRFGEHGAEFIRPIHSIILLYGDTVIPATIMGIASGRKTRGHRFHAPSWLDIPSADQYEKTLYDAKVIADFDKRKAIIIEKAQKALVPLAKHHAQLLPVSDSFINEIIGLVEWPVALLGSFDQHFLAIPKEVLIASMQDHQRYFPVIDSNNNALLAHFVVISNIESKAPEEVLLGNERVLNARLRDADFFYNTDQKETLAARLERLKGIVFQAKLGSLYEKAERLSYLTAYLQYGDNKDDATRAGLLAKADLTTLMVGEFPELQGVMGAYYALLQNETAAVSCALREHYLPRFSGDALPQSPIGIALAIADRIDNLVGSFGLSQLPTGDKDPYGLRRAAISIIRIIIEHQLHIDLTQLIDKAIVQYNNRLTNSETKTQLLTFFAERMRGFIEEQGFTPDVFTAVHALQLSDITDMYLRVQAVQAFKKTEVAQDLLTANKRVSNILAKQAQTKLASTHSINTNLFQQAVEQQLFDRIKTLQNDIPALCKTHQYQKALLQLSGLHSILNEYFDKVMIMADDAAIRENRILMLTILRSLFMEIADIALLQ